MVNEPRSSVSPVSPVAAVAVLGNLGRIDAVPWKNEGGQTRELCVEPAQSDFASFVWRASVADVGRDGDFSRFDGIDRTIVLLEGDGFEMLRQGEVAHDLREPFVPYRFAGEHEIAVRLHGAPTLDFNLMVRRDMAAGDVLRLDASHHGMLPPQTVLLYVSQGSAVLADEHGGQQALRAGDFVQLREDPPLPMLTCGMNAVVLAIRIKPHA